MKKFILLFISAIMLFTGCGEAPPAPDAVLYTDAASSFAVHFIDVGQADASLVLCDGKSMLIDGGNSEDSNLIAAYLKKHDFDFLDYIICTHAHEDHVGGLSGALSVAKAGAVYAPVTEADTKAYTNFKNKAAAQGLEIIHPTPGDILPLGSSSAQVVGPVTEATDELNNTSIVLKLSYGNTSFLFTGDAETDEEHDIINAGYDLSADVLKVGHHGSSSSSSYRFLREVMPEYAVISCGKDNSYGHPHDEVLSRLRDADINLLRTDLQGDIIITSDGEEISAVPSRNSVMQTNPTEKPASTPTQHEEYIGNKNTKSFHVKACNSVKTMKESNKISLTDRDFAIENGYSPCKNCNP